MPHEVYRGRYKKKYKRKTKALAMKDDYKLPSPRLAPKAGNLLTSRELDVAEESERIMDRLELRKGMMRRMRRLTPGRSGRFGRDGDGDGIYNEGKKKTGGIAPPPPRPSGRGLSQKEIARINSRPSIADRDVIPPRTLGRKVKGRPADPPFGSRPINPKRPNLGQRGEPVKRKPETISIRGNRIAPPPSRADMPRIAAERRAAGARSAQRAENLASKLTQDAASVRRARTPQPDPDRLAASRAKRRKEQAERERKRLEAIGRKGSFSRGDYETMNRLSNNSPRRRMGIFD